jgi:hypothetical protein
MQTRRTLLSVGLAIVVAAPIVLAQTAQPNTYISATYSNVTTQNDAAYLELVRTTGRKVLAEVMRANPKLIRYEMRQVVYPGVNLPRYNYISAITYDGPPPEPQQSPALREYLQKLNALRTSVGTVLFRTVASTAGLNIKEGNYVATLRAKIETGRAAEFYDLRSNLMLPLMAARVKEGAILGWTLSTVVFPGGTSAPWDAVTGAVYKDLASAVSAGPGGGGAAGNAALFAKVNPGKNYVAYVDSLRTTSKLVRRELQRVIIAIDRSSLGSTSSSQ